MHLSNLITLTLFSAAGFAQAHSSQNTTTTTAATVTLTPREHKFVRFVRKLMSGQETQKARKIHIRNVAEYGYVDQDTCLQLAQEEHWNCCRARSWLSGGEHECWDRFLTTVANCDTWPVWAARDAGA